jgi:hypothetical protein
MVPHKSLYLARIASLAVIIGQNMKAKPLPSIALADSDPTKAARHRDGEDRASHPQSQVPTTLQPSTRQGRIGPRESDVSPLRIADCAGVRRGMRGRRH